MELRTLRYFVAIADTGSVTAAASVVHVTQPSLSRQIRQLERSLGITLFVRTDRAMRLSAAGRRFLPVARELLARADAAEDAAKLIASGRMDRVTIAAPGTTITDVIAPFLATFGPEDPMPSLWEELPVSVYAALPRGADLMVGTTPPPGNLAGMPLANLPVWAYVSQDDEWASRRSVNLSDLARRNLLTLTSDFHPRRALDQAMMRTSTTPESIMEFATPQVAQALCAAGRGVAVLSDDPRFGLRPLTINTINGPLRISLYTAWEPQHHAAAMLADLSMRLRAFCAERYGQQVSPTADRARSHQRPSRGVDR